MLDPESSRKRSPSPPFLGPSAQAIALPNPLDGLSLPHFVLSEADVSKKMETHGFPELRRHWEKFKKLGLSLLKLDNSEIERSRNRHMAPLFSAPILLGAGVVGLSLYGTCKFVSLLMDMLPSMGPIARGCLFAMTACNYVFLTGQLLTGLQRYVIHPMERIMAKDVAFMLSKSNFKAWHSEQEKPVQKRHDLTALGVNENWDNPECKAYYQLKGEELRKIPASTHHEFVQLYLREFLGFKDPELRKFVPGIYLNDLKAGKKSVTEFVQKFQDKINANKSGSLSFEDSILLLGSLLDYVRPDSEGDKRLRGYILALGRKDYTGDGIVEAKVWERDPWRDLTHQEEFYSSASLRGVKRVGRGVKGRLGTFGYVRNKSISALDFTTQKGRVVRARLGATFAIGTDNKPHPILFVDGVEGSNSVNPKIIQAAIQNFAKDAGFEAVLYNKFVHNQVPKRFVAHVAKSGLPLRELNIEYVDKSTREYLDVFGLPVEPFEYAFPAGKVQGYLHLCKEDSTIASTKPTMWRSFINTLKKNTLWVIIGETTAYTGTILYFTTPGFLVPFLMFSAGGMAAHVMYQRRSLNPKFASST